MTSIRRAQSDSTLGPANSGNAEVSSQRSADGFHFTLGETTRFAGGPTAFYDLDYDYFGEGTDCKETIVIRGRPGLSTENVDFTFQTKCEPQMWGKRTIYFSGDQVMVGSSRQNIVLYARNTDPDTLFVMDTEMKPSHRVYKCTKSSGCKTQEDFFDVSLKDYVSKISEDLMLGSSSLNGIYVTLGRKKHNEEGKAFTLYEVNYDREEIQDKICQEKMEIKGRRGTEAENINYSVQYSCQLLTTRTLYFAGDEVILGGENQNIFLYAHEKIPNQLVVRNYDLLKFKDSGESDQPSDGAVISQLEDMLENLASTLTFIKTAKYSTQAESVTRQVDNYYQQIFELVKNVKTNDKKSGNLKYSPPTSDRVEGVPSKTSESSTALSTSVRPTGHKQLDDLITRIDKIGKTLKTTQTRLRAIDEQRALIQALQEENERLQEEARALSILLQESEQRSKRNTLEITGVSNSTQDQKPLEQTILEIASALGVTLKREDIDECFWWSSSRISVTFVRSRDCYQLLKAKERKKDFSTKHLGLKTDTHTPIQIRVALTDARWDLYLKARKLTTDHDYKAVWWDREGRVKAMKNDQVTVVEIRDEADLAQLIVQEKSQHEEK